MQTYKMYNKNDLFRFKLRQLSPKFTDMMIIK